jgi:hypothetical protein
MEEFLLFFVIRVAAQNCWVTLRLADLFALFLIADCARGVWVGGIFDGYFGRYAAEGWIAALRSQ